MRRKRTSGAISSLAIISCLALSSCVFLYDDDDEIVYGDNVTYGTPNYTSAYSVDNLNKDVVAETAGMHLMPSTGESKILVIPIEFADDQFTTDELETLENTFFGDTEDTGWESVASFYRKSSGGALNITGEVSPVLTSEYTVTEFEYWAMMYENYGGTYTDVLLEKALDTLEQETDIDLSEYDSDGDGYIDAVWMVYSAAYDTDSDIYWAYTTWASLNTTFDGVGACQYSWASIDFLYEGGYGTKSDTDKGDAHTFIHETGHLLGLDDYYSYDFDNVTNLDTPMAGFDMMDYNIGDHCAFSKYFLGWYDPIVITDEYLEEHDYEVTLDSQTETGQFLLIPSYTDDGEMQYNGTALDEYLIVEYYTPTGLYEQDAEDFYYGNGLRYYTKPGVLVYHVNATVGLLQYSYYYESWSWNGDAYDELLPADSLSGNQAYYYLFSNTKSYCYYEMTDATTFYRGDLISLLSATGKKISGYTNRNVNNYLYEEGDEFMIDDGIYDEFIFDDGTTPKYGFEVIDSDDESCTLRFDTIAENDQ